MPTMDKPRAAPRLPPAVLRRQSADALAKYLAAAAPESGIRAPLEPGLEYSLHGFVGLTDLITDILDVASAREHGAVILIRAGRHGLIVATIHGDTWSLVARLDPVYPENPQYLERTATTWTFLGGCYDDEGLPVSLCFDGDDSPLKVWTGMVCDLLAVLGLLDQQVGRRGGTRGGRSPGRTGGPRHLPRAVPNSPGHVP
jgi:hypothetical protein